MTASLRTTIPFSRINNDLITSANQQDILTEFWQLFSGNTHQHPDITGGMNTPDDRFQADFLYKSLIYVITESVGEYPYPFFSEKTWKSILTGRAFMMVNARYSLHKLQEFGFKTFSQWWDESYDTLPTVVDRIEAITKNLVQFKDFKLDQLNQLQREMLPVLQYNQQHLSQFAIDDLERIKQQLEI
jgi:hypothetical protein